MTNKSKSLHAGHRERMRGKLITYGREVFHTHELLEMLLYHVIPYKNTNPMAEELLHRFGNLEGVFSASADELLSVSGVGPRVAELISSLSLLDIESVCEPFEEECSKKFDDYRDVGNFFTEYFGEKLTREVVVLLLNNKMEYLACESVYQSDYELGSVKAQPFIDLAIKHRAAVAIIAHNHPYGPPFPTVGDRATNDMVARALSGAGVLLAEHYVITGKRYLGFMTNIMTPFSQLVDIERFLRSKEEII